MVFNIVRVRPNDRTKYQKRVDKLCTLLKDDTGRPYRLHVFILLTISGELFKRTLSNNFRDHPQARLFIKLYPASIRVRDIMVELDNIYAGDADDIDNLRGAVGEVFAYFICRKLYPRSDIEVKVEIGKWISGQIDTAGCNDQAGYCLQAKCSPKNLQSVVNQKRELAKIERLTIGKGKGAFITFVDRKEFNARLDSAGIKSSDYRIFDRTDLAALEQRLAS